MEKLPLSFLLLGAVDDQVVTDEEDKQEEKHSQHVGKDGELHICNYPEQLGSAPRDLCSSPR